MAIKEYIKSKKKQLEKYREKRTSKKRLKTQVRAENEARRLEAQAVRDKKLLGRLERQAKAKATIAKTTKFQEKHGSSSKLGKLKSGLSAVQEGARKAQKAGIGGGDMFSGNGNLLSGSNLFNKPKPKRNNKKGKSKRKSVFDIGF